MKKKHNRITKELLETAKGMHKVGILDDKSHEKITMRHLKGKLPVIDPMTSEEIRSLRE
jgi:putative transcriptional regulator